MTKMFKKNRIDGKNSVTKKPTLWLYERNSSPNINPWPWKRTFK